MTDYFGSWANEILTGFFHAVLVGVIFGKETEHVDNFSVEDEIAIGSFSKEEEHVI